MTCQYRLFITFALVLIGTVVNALPPKKIVGGQNAKPDEFPYQASLRVDGKHACGATIIDSKYVITAAHCVVGVVRMPYRNLLVVTGSTKSRSGQTHVVRTVLYNPKWSPGRVGLPHDIAIVALAGEIKFGPSQNKVGLPTAMPLSGQTAMITGWGYKTPGSLVTSEDLMKLQVKTITNVECQRMYGHQAVIDFHQMCTIAPHGQGFCQGDSGGPLVHNNQLIGIVSFNVPCGKGFPDVYTNVFLHLDWINQVMKM